MLLQLVQQQPKRKLHKGLQYDKMQEAKLCVEC
jgi:hypothetical protein